MTNPCPEHHYDGISLNPLELLFIKGTQSTVWLYPTVLPLLSTPVLSIIPVNPLNALNPPNPRILFSQPSSPLLRVVSSQSSNDLWNMDGTMSWWPCNTTNGPNTKANPVKSDRAQSSIPVKSHRAHWTVMMVCITCLFYNHYRHWCCRSYKHTLVYL